MAEYTTIVSVTYQILGEAEEFALNIPITANSSTSVYDLMVQLQTAADSEETIDVFTRLGRALVSHMAQNTKDIQ